MKLSVVVATHDRAGLLPRHAAAMMAQDFSGFEVVYVDDGSTDATPSALAELAAAHPGRIRWLRQENRGPGPARNAAAAIAAGDLLVIADDDAFPGPDWLSRLVAAHAARGCDALAYAYGLLPDAPPPARYMHHRNLLVTGTRPRTGYIGPALFILSKDWYARAGGFPEARLDAAEDFLFCRRLIAAGARVGFDPGIVVPHRFPETWEGVRRRVAATARTGLAIAGGLGRSPRGLVLRGALKWLGSPLWSLWHYPPSLYFTSIRMETLFFLERLRAHAGTRDVS